MKPHFCLGRSVLTVICFFGILAGVSRPAFATPEEQAMKRDMVYVEPSGTVTTEVSGEYKLQNYPERRDSYGVLVSVGYSSYEPVNYEPNFANPDYEGLYSSPSVPLIELQLNVKKNFSLGSLGLEAAIGTFRNDNSNSEIADSTLALMPIRVGVMYAMDTLFFSEPFVVPYASVGGYTMIYKESLGGNSLNGNTKVAMYYSAGLAFQLNWIDHQSARISHEDVGLENTFVFAEGRQFLASGVSTDPDFGDTVHWGTGLRVEF